ncbi:MAG TPA: sigma 54-interacting transcriptional regulator [Gemmatimonadales bacterium]|nr:sigma 54-interacting transcriptional regulator [Gemmatimonadales bacterium]
MTTLRPGTGVGGPRRTGPAPATEVALSPIVGASPRMQRVLRLVSRIAPTESTVLILGESGTGKELIARSLHVLSRRAQGPFVAVNVAALPESLIESELFGSAKGAFTGATADRAGLVEEADHGTLFLDEIGDMPLATQVRLLRTLENSEVRRLGENTPRHVDVRVVAATHRDLQVLAAEGRFREDLYYRLNVVQLELPPLRERAGDLGLLASFFLDRAARRMGRKGLRFTPEAMALLARHDWPGNVRELENAIEHAVSVSEGMWLGPPDLPASVRSPRLLTRGSLAGGTPDAEAGAARGRVRPPRDPDLRSLEEVTREHVLRVLARHDDNATAAARVLGVSRTTLWRMLKRWGVKRPAHQGK